MHMIMSFIIFSGARAWGEEPGDQFRDRPLHSDGDPLANCHAQQVAAVIMPLSTEVRARLNLGADTVEAVRATTVGQSKLGAQFEGADIL